MVKEGDRAPDFELPSLAGKQVRLGLITPLWPVLLVFFRTSCEACERLMPVLIGFQRNYGNADIEILAVSQDGRLRTEEFVERVRWPGRVLIDHPEQTVSEMYGIDRLPALVLVGTDMGVIATADASRLESIEEMSRSVASVVGWSYKRILPVGMEDSEIEPCLSRTRTERRDELHRQSKAS